jgi:hypothetical protein
LEVVESPFHEDLSLPRLPISQFCHPPRGGGAILLSGMFYIISTSLREDAMEDGEENGEFIDSK